MNAMWFCAVFILTWLHSCCCCISQFLLESSSISGFSCGLPQKERERERESRFRKLEACALQVFELCHWRQHSHKVDGCPSPEVFSCQQACSARRRWIQTLSASQTGSFVLVFVKPLVPPPPPPPPPQKKPPPPLSLWNRTDSRLFKNRFTTPF